MRYSEFLKCYNTTFLPSEANVEIAYILTFRTSFLITESLKPSVIQPKPPFYCSLHFISLTAKILVSSDSFYGDPWAKSLKIHQPLNFNTRRSVLTPSKLS